MTGTVLTTHAPQGYDVGMLPSSLFDNFLVMLTLLAFDHGVAKHTRARWFCLHAFANLLVVLTAARSVYACVVDPLNCPDSRQYTDRSLFGSASTWPVVITNSIHVYHVVAFPLTSDERFHHFLFVPTVGLMGQYFSWGAIQGSLGFFISGLPGGIDYLMLTLVKHGLVPLMVQKRLCAVLNVYVRGPAIVIVAFIMQQSYRYGTTTVPLPVGLFIAAIAIFNALYYTKQSVANFAITHAVNNLPAMPEAAAVTPEQRRAYLRCKELKAPQQTMS